MLRLPEIKVFHEHGGYMQGELGPPLHVQDTQYARQGPCCPGSHCKGLLKPQQIYSAL